jgi:hypothetical protein
MVQKKTKKPTPHTEHFLGIPASLSNIKMAANMHDLYIVITADCNWCYSDPDGCFSPKQFLKQGTKRKGHVYGPYTPIKKGKVFINAVPWSPGKEIPCNPFKPKPAGGHTITVGGP